MNNGNRLHTTLLRFTFRLGVLLILGHLVQACASVSAPEGGPKDEDPPEVIVEKSTPNLQTNFAKQDIILTFNEWVQLQDEFRQVVISPPLDKQPDIKLKGKKLIFAFDEEEVLKDDVTYTINFGEAVQDLTERNPAKDLRFVFSTGDEIDSLTLDGKVTEAFTGEPVEDALFMLYVSQDDSIVYKEKPYYFGRSDKEGNFRIPNIREGAYKGFALVDGNLNYLYDQSNEKIGFLLDPIIVSDSMSPVEISIYSERSAIRRTRTDTATYGRIKLTFNQSPEDVQLASASSFIPTYRKERLDTLIFWYDLPDLDSATLFLQVNDSLNFDTLTFNIPDRDTFLANSRLNYLNSVSRTHNPLEPLTLRFNHPLSSIDTGGIRLQQDSLPDLLGITTEIDSTNAWELQIRYAWLEDSLYMLTVLPGTITDQYGIPLQDTLEIPFKVDQLKRYGSLNLSFINFPKDTAYVISLMLGDKSVKEFFMNDVEELNTRLNGLKPGSYELLVIEDINQNGRWDPGNYQKKTLPEKVIRRKIDPLRANWEVDFTLDFTVPVSTPPPTLDSPSNRPSNRNRNRN